MGLEIVLSLIGIVGAIVVALISGYNIRKVNEKLNESQAKKVQIETDKLMFEYKNTIIKDMYDQIDILRKEVNILKTHEILHLEEKVKLEYKIESLIRENKSLENKMNDNKSKYEEDLISLKNKLTLMSQEIEIYKRGN